MDGQGRTYEIMTETKKGAKLGKIIGNVLKGALREIPVVGGVIGNIESPDGGVGKIEKSQLAGQIIAGGFVAITVMYGLGWINTTAFELIVEVIKNVSDAF